MKTRGLLRIFPFLLVAFKDKIQEAFRHDKIEANATSTVGKYKFGGCRERNLQSIYTPQRKKLKGYQKQTTTFNKRKRAA